MTPPPPPNAWVTPNALHLTTPVCAVALGAPPGSLLPVIHFLGRNGATDSQRSTAIGGRGGGRGRTLTLVDKSEPLPRTAALVGEFFASRKSHDRFSHLQTGCRMFRRSNTANKMQAHRVLINKSSNQHTRRSVSIRNQSINQSLRQQRK